MTAEEAIDLIVQQVLQKLEERKKRALVVFTGAAIGFDVVLPQLKQLLSEGWQFKVLLSDSASYVLTPELIQKELKIESIEMERTLIGLKSLYEGVSQIIIPTLTMNTAAKLALGIADTAVTNLLAHAFMEGIPTVAVRDGCDPSNPTRRKLGMNQTPQAYLNRFDQHLSSLESYGMRLVSSASLYQAVAGKTETAPPAVKPAPVQQQQAEPLFLNHRIISQTDVLKAKEAGGILLVTRQALVTPLAKDTARDFGVAIRYQA